MVRFSLSYLQLKTCAVGRMLRMLSMHVETFPSQVAITLYLESELQAIWSA